MKNRIYGLKSIFYSLSAAQVWLAVRLALGVLGVMALLLIPSLPPGGTADYGGATLYGWADRLLGVWTRWDGQWYLKIADAGYVGEGSSAFYPLYPMLVKAVGIVLFPLGPYRYIVAALLVSGVAFYFALSLLHAATRELALPSADGGLASSVTAPTSEPLAHDIAVADKTVLYLAVFPTAFFFFAAYSEALFLLFAIGSLYAARRSAWWWAGLAAGLAILTRSFGLVLFLPLAYEYWRQARSGRGWRTDVLSLALPPLALAGLAGYAYVRFGDFAAFLNTQDLWFRHFSLPWETLGKGFRDVIDQPLQYAVANMNLANLAVALLFVLLAVLCWFALPSIYCIYLDLGVLFALSTAASAEPLLSVSRFVLVLFPGFMLLAIAGRRSRTFHLIWLLLSVMLLALLFIRFANWYWVA